MKKLKWDNKEIIIEIINPNNSYEIKKDYLELLSLYEFKLNSFAIPNFQKRIYEDNEIFYNHKTTDFQRELIDIFFENDYTTMYIGDYNHNYKYKNDFNFIENAILFFNKLNPEFTQEIKKALEDKRIHISEFNKIIAGNCTKINDNCFYYITNNKSESTFLNFVHEITHGITYDYFDYDFKTLYAEMPSILVELLANDYAKNNNLISEFEYTKNLKNINDAYIYNDYQVTSLLKYIIQNNINSIKDINKLSKEYQKENGITFNFKALTKDSLERLLTYTYSAIVAISIYDKYKDNPKKALEIALNIVKNITLDNEKELISYFDIDLENSVLRYVKNSNQLIKKMK
ncbi:MAG: hypothetical protein IJ094_10655 [Bacilli bacterium]|nr:hypothetical protein [Bacilli bacterium]